MFILLNIIFKNINSKNFYRIFIQQATLPAIENVLCIYYLITNRYKRNI